MNYRKPRVVALAKAITVIQSNPVLKGLLLVFAQHPALPQRITISAYEGDE